MLLCLGLSISTSFAQEQSEKHVYDILQSPYGHPEVQKELIRQRQKDETTFRQGWTPSYCLKAGKKCDVRGSVATAIFDDFKARHDVPQYMAISIDSWICGGGGDEYKAGEVRKVACDAEDTVAIGQICILDQKQKFCKNDWTGSAYFLGKKPKYVQLNTQLKQRKAEKCGYIGMVNDYVFIEQKYLSEKCYTTYRDVRTDFQVVDYNNQVLYFPQHIVELNTNQNPLIVRQVDNKTDKSCSLKVYDKKLFFPTVWFKGTKSYLLDVKYIQEVGVSSCDKDREINILE